MKLRTKYFLFIVILHSILVLLAVQLIDKYQALFFAVEALILISIWISIRLYLQFIRPLNLIAIGVESIKDKDFSSKFLKVGQYELDQLIEVYNRMIDQLREERIKAKEQHYFLDRLINASPSGIIVLDFNNKIDALNPAAESMLGLQAEQVLTKTLTELNGNLTLELDRLQAGEAKIININGIQTYKCRKSHFLDRGFHHHFILVEELTEEILKTEKKAYGKVIRMMSHEINNSAGAINSILNTCLNYKNQLNDNDRPDYENALLVAIGRNTRLNRFMSNFADVIRIPTPLKKSCQVHDLLYNVSALMNAECEKRRIEWSWDLSQRPLTVQLDIQQIEQVLVNVIKNALEAIDTEGVITVQTGHVPVKHLVIGNNGRGIAKDVQQKLFTPFFSTKKDGQGIGLTITREILINHQFRFSLATNEKGFTDFRIEFDRK